MRLLALTLLFAACNPDDTGDTGDTDLGTGTDTDTGSDTDVDTSTFEPLDGFGTLSGDCGLLDADELGSTQPYTFSGELTLPAGFDDDELSTGGLEMVTDGNLNSSSLYSEVFSYEVLYRCEEAELLLTEGEITYDDPNGKKTDLVIDVDGYRVGMSVVRAVGWPREDPWTVDDATPLLEDKLADILVSSDNASDADAWDKSLLHVVAYSPEHATSVLSALEGIDSAVRGGTIVWVTATNGEDGFIYGD